MAPQFDLAVAAGATVTFDDRTVRIRRLPLARQRRSKEFAEAADLATVGEILTVPHLTWSRI
jgi:hypothetical protein